MSALPLSRVNYFDRQYIRLAELTDEQAYHLQMHRRHNQSHHSWGIVTGLDLVVRANQPVVLPGLAVDGYGRELLLSERAVFSRTDFDRLSTNRIDLWLEYRLALSSDAQAPIDCGANDPRQAYRATELAEVVVMRAGAVPDPRKPPNVAPDALAEPLLATSDDPADRWPVYLGRMIMQVPTSGTPTFTVDASTRAYVGLSAEIIDHPGNSSRIELGRTDPDPDERVIGPDTVKYAGGTRDFAVFTPNSDGDALQPTLSIYGSATQVLGTAEIHGNVVLDGASLQFANPDVDASEPATDDRQPALYRVGSSDGDELRIDVGELDDADRSIVIGMTKDGKFQPALTITFPSGLDTSGTINPKVTINGDLQIQGTISSPDIRTRTVTEDVAALLTGMIQAAIAAGAS